MAEAEEKEKTKEALETELTAFKKAINVTPNSRSNLTTALANAASLLLQAHALGLDSQISELLQAAENQVKNFEEMLVQELIRDTGDKASQAAEEQRRLEETLHKAKVATFIAEATRLEAQHHDFKRDVNDIITRQQQKEKLLSKAIQNIENNGQIDPHELATIIRTREEINEEYEQKQRVYKYQNERTQHYSEVSAHQKKLEEKQQKLQDEINLENVKPVHAQLPDIHKKRVLLKYHTDNMRKFSPIVQNAKKGKDEADFDVQTLERKNAERQLYMDQLKEKMQQSIPNYQDSPTLINFWDLLDNEESASKDGVVRDQEQRENFLSTYLPVTQGNLDAQPLQFPEDSPSKLTQKQSTIALPNDNKNNTSHNLVQDKVQEKIIKMSKKLKEKTESIIKRLQASSKKSSPSFQKKISQRYNTKVENHDR